MNVLSIGNSFSQDAHRWLHDAAASVGVEMTCVNLYIGGCSLKRHSENLHTGDSAYSLEINGEPVRRIALQEAIGLEQWDVVTLQQVSGLSGDFSTWEPYLSGLYEFVKKSAPEARILLHETWSYEADSTHPDFAKYDCDREKMDACIAEAYRQAKEKLGIGLIPTGPAIRFLRTALPAFDPAKGGMKLTRDGFHLSLNYGRYAAALVWLYTLTGTDIRKVTFVPEIDNVETDASLICAIREHVYQFMKSEITR